MTTHNFSVEEIVLALIERLDRRNIFPPMSNAPETFLPKIDDSIDLSLRRPKKCPNAFFICKRNVQDEAARRGAFNMRVITKATGILWRTASSEEQEVYNQLASRVEELHWRRTSTI